MSIKESINQCKTRIKKEIVKLNKNTRIAILAGVIGCFVLSTVLVMASGAEVYSLTIAGKNAGYITNTALIDEAVKEIKADYSNGKEGINLSVDKRAIEYKGTDLEKNDVNPLTVKELEKKIVAADICTAKEWAVNIDGKNIAAVTSKKSAEQILAEVKNHYLSSNSKLLSANFKENVFVTQAAINVADIMKPDDAVTLLVTGEKKPEIYTVKDGDTIWDIAAENGMSANELQKANPGFDPNKLKLGQKLNLFVVKPYVTVETKELVSSTEKIDFNTVYESTSSLFKGETKVKTAGVYGTKEVSSEVTKENGVIIATKVVESVITAQPQNQIALKGTKASIRYVASRGGNIRNVSVSASGSDIVSYAKKFIGVPYVHGGSSPDGFDCSGFTKYVYTSFGASLPRTAAGQYNCGSIVDKSQLKPGDLVFFKTSSDSSRISHVGIYVGGGNFIHSPQPGETVKISNLSTSYNTKHYCGAVRVTM